MARNLARFDPLAEFSALQRRFFEDGIFSPMQGFHRPAIDVYTEDDGKMTVEAHLPQFEEKDITVGVDQGALVIQAERSEKTEDPKKNYVVRESSSSYYRRVALPDHVEEDKIVANFNNGVLKVMVPYRELPSPKKIEITSGS